MVARPLLVTVLLSAIAVIAATAYCSGALDRRVDSSSFYLFVSSYSNGTISRIDPLTGSSSVVVSGLYQPEGGTCDSGGKLYFAQPAAGRIVRLDQGGSNVMTILSSASLLPEGPSFDSSGDLFFATRQGANGAVWQIPGGSPGAMPLQATAPFTGFSEGTAFTRQGELLAVDAYGARVLKFAQPYGPSNQGRVVASGSPYWNGITVADNGDLYVAGGSDGRILHFDPSGRLLSNITGMRYPGFLQFGPDGYLYATDFVFQAYPGQIDSVVRIAPGGSIQVLAYLPGALGLAICPSSGSGGPPFPGTEGFPLLSQLILLSALVGGAAVAVIVLLVILIGPPDRMAQQRGTCANCGATVGGMTMYCPTCGKPLGSKPP